MENKGKMTQGELISVIMFIKESYSVPEVCSTVLL